MRTVAQAKKPSRFGASLTTLSEFIGYGHHHAKLAQCRWVSVKCSSCSKRTWHEKKPTSSTRCGATGTPAVMCHRCQQNADLARTARAATRPPHLVFRHAHTSQTPAVASRELLDELGISQDEFHALTRLQERDISPNDYDLLLRLHVKPNTKKLEAAKVSSVSETFVAPGDWSCEEICAVCLCALAPGEELSRLTCEGRHVFHSHCIKEWLVNANSCCPIDKHDFGPELSVQCLTA
jgi:hypothetical protein